MTFRKFLSVFGFSLTLSAAVAQHAPCRFNRELSSLEQKVARSMGCKGLDKAPSSTLLKSVLITKPESLRLKTEDVPELVEAQVALRTLRGIESSKPRLTPSLLEAIDSIHFDSLPVEVLFRSAVFACTDGMEAELNFGALEKRALQNPKRFLQDLNSQVVKAAQLANSAGCGSSKIDETKVFSDVLTQIFESVDDETGKPDLKNAWTSARGTLLPQLQQPLPIWKRLTQP